MPTVGTTSRPGYVYDQGTDTWIPIGVGPHSHDTSSLVPYSGFFVAGKNKIINGDFNINQRNFSSSVISSSATVFGADRWRIANDAGSGTVTYSIQQFTTGSAPVAGYEAKQYTRIVTTGQTLAGTYTILCQPIEDVRTLAGQTATISFWAKAASGTPKIAVEIQQVAAGSSPRTYLGQVTISTSWARYSVTAAIPAISGTITADNRIDLNIWVSGGSTYNANTGSIGIQSNTFDIWGVQVEAGNVATPFQTATGTLAGELAACQRYYWRVNGDSANDMYIGFGSLSSTTNARIGISPKTTMRTKPTVIDVNDVRIYRDATTVTPSAVAISSGDGNNVTVNATIASGTSGVVAYIMLNNSSGAYIGLGAEL